MIPFEDLWCCISISNYIVKPGQYREIITELKLIADVA
uniref:Uncharacterized protein n=1 Tax=Tetranychus urticae TaxID=32264 RepID=T1KV75_TETUR